MMTIASRRPLTGARTVLPVIGQRTRRHGRAWVEVLLPGRPNGSAGWITTTGTMPSWTPWRLSVSLSARLITVYNRGRIARRFSVIVGEPSTPTPQGRFFIEEGLSMAHRPPAPHSRWRPAPGRTSCKSSMAARGRSPFTGWTISPVPSEPRPRTVASDSARPTLPGWRCVSVLAYLSVSRGSTC